MSRLAMPRGREAQARAFYAGLLGMTELPKPAALAPRGGCWFASGSAVLHLGVEEPFSPARKAHPALLVEELDALEAALTAAGRACVRADGEFPASGGSTPATPSATGWSSSRPTSNRRQLKGRQRKATLLAVIRFRSGRGFTVGVHIGGVGPMLGTWTQTRSLRSVR